MEVDIALGCAFTCAMYWGTGRKQREGSIKVVQTVTFMSDVYYIFM